MKKITDVKGIGEATKEILSKHGIRTVKELTEVNIDRLIDIPGFSEMRASRVISEAQILVEGSAEMAKVKSTKASERTEVLGDQTLTRKKIALKKKKKAKGRKTDSEGKDEKKGKKKKAKKDKNKGKKAKKTKKIGKSKKNKSK